jgi:hypothetical protein
MAKKCQDSKREPIQEKMIKPLEVQGVGAGTQKAVWKIKMPIAVTEDSEDGPTMEHIFEVPTLEGDVGQEVPALLGLRSMRGKQAVLQMQEGKEMLSFPGDGGYTIEWSPGTQHIPLTVAPSGHYVIPCDSYEKIVAKQGGLPASSTVLHSHEQGHYYIPELDEVTPPPSSD